MWSLRQDEGLIRFFRDTARTANPTDEQFIAASALVGKNLEIVKERWAMEGVKGMVEEELSREQEDEEEDEEDGAE